MSATVPPLRWEEPSPLRELRPEPLGEGDFCICYRVDGHVLRVAKHAEASEALARERCLLPRLAPRSSIAIPEIVGGGRREDTGDGFVVYPLLPGEPLERARLEALEPPLLDALVGQMADFARELHAVPIEAAEGCGLTEVDPRRGLPALVRRASSALESHLPATVLAYHERLLGEYLEDPALHEYRPAILHGDLSPGHFLFDTTAGRLTGVIDFGDAFLGDPLRDLIFILEDYGEEVLGRFLAHYSPKHSDRARRRVRIFQELDNLDYALSRLAQSDKAGFRQALRTLAAQAGG